MKLMVQLIRYNYFLAFFLMQISVISFRYPSAICHIQNPIPLLLSLSLLVSLQRDSTIGSFLRAKELQSSSPGDNLI
jgi:hypothetical protein